jgi:hypothetical protein
MSPLSVIKYMVEHLQGTLYEPWVNALLFMMLFVAIYAAISLLIGRGGRKLVLEATLAVATKIKGRRGYAPEWENIRLRFEPYIEFVSSVYFGFVGLYSGTLVGFAMVISRNKASLWAYCGGIIWVLASFFYMRVNLESTSWAYHRIKSRNR